MPIKGAHPGRQIEDKFQEKFIELARITWVGVLHDVKMDLHCPQGIGTLRQQLLMMHGIAWYYMVLHGIAWYYIVLHGIAC